MEFNLFGHSSCGMDLTDGTLKSAQTYSLSKSGWVKAGVP